MNIGDVLIDDATKERTDFLFGLSRARMAEKTEEESHKPIEWTAGEGVKNSE